MPAPTIKLWQVTGEGSPGGNAGNDTDSIKYLNDGGIIAVQVSGIQKADHGNADAGVFDTPVAYIIEAEGNTIERVFFKVFDSGNPNPADVVSSVGEDFFDTNPWEFKVMLTGSYIDPASIASNTIESSNDWHTLPHGEQAGFQLDLSANLPATDNEGNSNSSFNTLVNHVNDPGRHFLNYYIYIAIKPRATATPGEHVDWQYRVEAVYPAS